MKYVCIYFDIAIFHRMNGSIFNKSIKIWEFLAIQLDDALSATRLPDGRIKVWIHVADPTCLVKPRSIIDRSLSLWRVSSLSFLPLHLVFNRKPCYCPQGGNAQRNLNLSTNCYVSNVPGEACDGCYELAAGQTMQICKHICDFAPRWEVIFHYSPLLISDPILSLVFFEIAFSLFSKGIS